MSDKDFLQGSLKKESFIRPNKLFTADKATFAQRIGYINLNKQQKVSDIIAMLINN